MTVTEEIKVSILIETGFHCIPCRCKRQFYHKETKTVRKIILLQQILLLLKEIFSLVVTDVIPIQMLFSKMKIDSRQVVHLKSLKKDWKNARQT